jgi:hypothetical protein
MFYGIWTRALFNGFLWHLYFSSNGIKLEQK